MSKIQENYQAGDSITWLQVHNLVPIISMIVAALTVFYVLQSKVELQNQRLTFFEGRINECFTDVQTVSGRLNKIELDIKEIQTKGSVKGISTIQPKGEQP